MHRQPPFRGGRPGRVSVRLRTTAMSALVVGVALALGATGLLFTLQHALLRGNDDVALTRAHDLAALAAAGRLPRRLTATNEDDIVQVVDESGTVLAATSRVAGKPAITSFLPSGSDPVVHTVTVSDGTEHDAYRVWALRTDSAGGPVTLYLGTNTETVSETMAAVRRALGFGLPTLLVLLAVTSWWLLGRTLRPVEAIRAEVADITESELTRRVPVPSSRDEVGRLARTMNAMLDRLEAASRRQRSFVADASHELRSPLAAIRAELEVSLTQPSRTDWPVTAARLLEDSDRMERLVRDLLFLARSDAEAAPPATDDLADLDDVVLEEVARLRLRTSLPIDTAAVSAAPVRGSREELCRLVRNLLDNATRHAATRVVVGLRVVDGTAELVVEDDGPGIAPEHRQLVFDRFVRLDGDRSRGKGGAGLGLAIAQAIAVRHAGSIHLDPNHSGADHSGARFVVRIPQAP